MEPISSLPLFSDTPEDWPSVRDELLEMTNELRYPIALLGHLMQRISYVTGCKVAKLIAMSESTSKQYLLKDGILLWAGCGSLICRPNCLVGVGDCLANRLFRILLLDYETSTVNSSGPCLLPKSVGIMRKALGKTSHPTFPIWLNIPLSKSSAFFKPLSICETLAVGMAIITP